MKFIIGIGNPGKKYENTRHNAGFKVLEILAGRWKKEKQLNALTARLGDEVLLVKPETFVNQTGEAVAAILKWHKANGQNFLFVCDDANLDFGKMRLRDKGSAGGHHGLESAIGVLQTEAFPRLRIGIRNPDMPEALSDFVLGRFDAGEAREFKKILDRAASVCKAWAEADFKAAQKILSRLQSMNPKEK